jgi:hypothetical protein
MSYTDNPLADFESHEAEKQKWLDSRPICCICKEPIQESKMIYYNDQHCCPLYEYEWEFWQGIREDFLEDAG